MSGRPKGYIESWNPRSETRRVLDMVEGVLAEYREHWPLTIRQIFYRLVGRHGYEKTERGYARLQEYLAKARRAGLIPFEAIRDDGTVERRPSRFDGLPGFWRAVRSAARGYRTDKRHNQPWRVVVMVEAAGMVPQAVRVAHPLDAPVLSSGGFDSLTAKHDLAATAAELAPVAFLHVGDHDPSGVCVFESIRADALAFIQHDAPEAAERVVFERVAVTLEQAERFSLPTAPAKASDRRGNGVAETVQAEALPPETLAAIIEEAILRYTDVPQFESDRGEEAEERDSLLAAVEAFMEGEG